MQNLHITCENLEQRQNVFNVLDGMGLRPFNSTHGDYLQINAEINLPEPREYMTCVEGGIWPKSEILNYTQFMEQYSMQALRNTIKNSGLSNPELSIKLGHSRKYLTNLLNDGCSTELQNRLIHEISEVMAGTFKTDAEVIAELSQRLAETQDELISSVRSERAEADKLSVAQKEIKKLQAANIQLMQESDSNHNANTDLKLENQTLRKNSQNHDISISEHQATITHLTAQLNQSRETMSKQNALNESLNAECAELAEKLGFKTKEFYELTEQLDIKKHGEITMIKTIHKLRKSEMYHRIFAFICLTVIVLLSVIKWGV